MTEHRDAEADATEDDFQLSRHDLNAIERAIDEGDGPLLDGFWTEHVADRQPDQH
ncbi:hypothetical protein [Paracoccus mutanolyticus]|uniref:hypothetical protein n=1 Tax=Paracoccus mutanolyticus TaxID=1499308 RepID=UPI001674142E|nr:hypothetical protein [Paracoccus mutanolyticus]